MAAPGPAGRPVDDGGCGDRLSVEDGRENLVELVGGHARDGGLPVDELFLDHFGRDADGGDAGPFSIPGLEHVYDGVLDCELEVLHVPEVGLEDLADVLQLLVGGGHHVMEGQDRLWRSHAGDHVLALGIHQEFTVEHLLARRRVARECDAGTRLVAGVAVDHRLHIDRGAPFLGNVVLAAIDDRAVVHPGAEYGPDGALQLCPGIGREKAVCSLLDQGLEADDELLQVVDRQLRVVEVAILVALPLQIADHGLERLVVLVGTLLHSQDDVAVHLDEAAVAVPGKTVVGGLLCEGGDGLVVQAQV